MVLSYQEWCEQISRARVISKLPHTSEILLELLLCLNILCLPSSRLSIGEVEVQQRDAAEVDSPSLTLPSFWNVPRGGCYRQIPQA